MNLTGNPCGVDEEAFGWKFGLHAYCPEVVGGIPPFLRTNSGVVSKIVCDHFHSRFPKSLLVIILKSFAAQLLLQTPTITIESTQDYKTCIRKHPKVRFLVCFLLQAEW
jgi:hypothetical protein